MPNSQSGRTDAAGTGLRCHGRYEKVLRLDGGHKAARQALVALLLEAGRNQDAEKVLQDGVKGKPENTEFTMLLARLQVARGALEQAGKTLENRCPLPTRRPITRHFSPHCCSARIATRRR